MVAGHGDHSDLWSYIEGLREDLGRAEARLHDAEERVCELEKQAAVARRNTPAALQAEREADEARADLAASGHLDYEG